MALRRIAREAAIGGASQPTPQEPTPQTRKARPARLRPTPKWGANKRPINHKSADMNEYELAAAWRRFSACSTTSGADAEGPIADALLTEYAEAEYAEPWLAAAIGADAAAVLRLQLALFRCSAFQPAAGASRRGTLGSSSRTQTTS